MKIDPVVSEIQPRTNRQTNKQTNKQTDKPTKPYIDRSAVYNNVDFCDIVFVNTVKINLTVAPPYRAALATDYNVSIWWQNVYVIIQLNLLR